MYRVEVTRKHDMKLHDGTKLRDVEDKHIYEVETDFELTCILEAMKHGVDGEYSAFITSVESEENK